jgi:competence protein ComEC
MAGMFAVLSNFRPRELWLPSGIPQAVIERLLQEARQFGIRANYFAAGDILSIGGAAVSVLAPARARAPEPGSHRNDESLVLKVSYGRTSALLEGDAEKMTEKLIEAENPAADVLKVAHHGSGSSTSDALLAAVRPRFAVISVGARNVYHHPRAEVLERLQNSRVHTYRTDINGATSFFLDGNSVTPQPATIP